jgi:PIN domain nuclease of toxin-antitoxin system
VERRVTLLLDTHVVHWWSAEPERLSAAAAAAVTGADELAVAGVTWYELAWLATHERITIAVPLTTWLATLAADVRTVGITPALAYTAASLPSSFPGDPADRLIYATAVEFGWQCVTKDRRLRDHPHPREVTVW